VDFSEARDLFVIIFQIPRPNCKIMDCGLILKNYTFGRVNHVAVEEAQEAPDVVIGMFLINDTSVVVLFDSTA
jgi:hypothetical protein